MGGGLSVVDGERALNVADGGVLQTEIGYIPGGSWANLPEGR